MKNYFCFFAHNETLSVVDVPNIEIVFLLDDLFLEILCEIA